MIRNLSLFLIWVSSVLIMFVVFKPDEWTELPLQKDDYDAVNDCTGDYIRVDWTS